MGIALVLGVKSLLTRLQVRTSSLLPRHLSLIQKPTTNSTNRSGTVPRMFKLFESVTTSVLMTYLYTWPLTLIIQDWNPVVPRIIERIPWVRRYANVAGRALDHWSFEDRVILLGDAAHTHGGAFAAGASLAIDDAYALSLALDEVFSPTTGRRGEKALLDQIHRVLDLYESTRRPHTAKVLAIVHENRQQSRARTERRQAGQAETDEEFRNRVSGRSDPAWLNEHDVETAFRKVVQEKSLTAPIEPQVRQQARL